MLSNEQRTVLERAAQHLREYSDIASPDAGSLDLLGQLEIEIACLLELAAPNSNPAAVDSRWFLATGPVTARECLVERGGRLVSFFQGLVAGVVVVVDGSSEFPSRLTALTAAREFCNRIRREDGMPARKWR